MPGFPSEALTRRYAESLDAQDPLRCLREEFLIPSKENLKTTRLTEHGI